MCKAASLLLIVSQYWVSCVCVLFIWGFISLIKEPTYFEGRTGETSLTHCLESCEVVPARVQVYTAGCGTPDGCSEGHPYYLLLKIKTGDLTSIGECCAKYFDTILKFFRK